MTKNHNLPQKLTSGANLVPLFVLLGLSLVIIPCLAVLYKRHNRTQQEYERDREITMQHQRQEQWNDPSSATIQAPFPAHQSKYPIAIPVSDPNSIPRDEHGNKVLPKIYRNADGIWQIPVRHQHQYQHLHQRPETDDLYGPPKAPNQGPQPTLNGAEPARQQRSSVRTGTITPAMKAIIERDGGVIREGGERSVRDHTHIAPYVEAQAAEIVDADPVLKRAAESDSENEFEDIDLTVDDGVRTRKE